MDMELPEDKGTYILLVSLNQAKRLEIKTDDAHTTPPVCDFSPGRVSIRRFRARFG
jgi:hypothetical protein